VLGSGRVGLQHKDMAVGIRGGWGPRVVFGAGGTLLEVMCLCALTLLITQACLPQSPIVHMPMAVFRLLQSVCL